MTPDPLATSYDRVAAEYTARIADELAGKPLDRALLLAFAEQVRPLGPVADLGCGAAARALAGGAGGGLAGALPGMPAGAAGGAGSGAVPAVYGLWYAQPLDVAEPAEAGVGAPTADVTPAAPPRRRGLPTWGLAAACAPTTLICVERPDSRRKPHEALRSSRQTAPNVREPRTLPRDTPATSPEKNAPSFARGTHTPNYPKLSCHGVFLDGLSAAERGNLQTRELKVLVEQPEQASELIVCPKPHLGPWRVDLVRRDQHCLCDPTLCHIIGQEGVHAPVRPPRSINDLLHELKGLFDKEGPDAIDDVAAAAVAERVMALSRRFAEISGGLKRIKTYEAQLRIYGGMGKTLHLLGPAERESLALAAFLVEQITEVGASDYSAPTMHVASVIELEVQRRLLAVPGLTGAGFQHGRPTFGTLSYMRDNPRRTGGDWERLVSHLATHWQAPEDPNDPGRQISFDDFVSYIAQARRTRNRAAHTSPVSQEEYGAFYQAACQSGPLRIGALNALLLGWAM